MPDPRKFTIIVSAEERHALYEGLKAAQRRYGRSATYDSARAALDCATAAPWSPLFGSTTDVVRASDLARDFGPSYENPEKGARRLSDELDELDRATGESRR